MTVSLARQTGTCGHCGRADVGTSTVGAVVFNGELLCMPRASGRPRCTRLVMTFGHPMDCRCEERYPIAGDRTRAVWA